MHRSHGYKNFIAYSENISMRFMNIVSTFPVTNMYCLYLQCSIREETLYLILYPIIFLVIDGMSLVVITLTDHYADYSIYSYVDCTTEYLVDCSVAVSVATLYSLVFAVPLF